MIGFVARVTDELVEDALRELADESDQRRLWLSSGEHGAEVSSVTECISKLWDDGGLGEVLDRGDVVYTAEIMAVFVSCARGSDVWTIPRGPAKFW